MTEQNVGEKMYSLAERLFPITRSITGDGVRETLAIIKEYIPELTIHEVPSGTRAFDWTVPDEWNIHDAYILDPNGEKIVDFQKSNLHVVGYSTPIDITLPLEELQEHLYSLPDQPNAIPYITSYYKKRWGFCLTHNQREALPPGDYRAVIKSTLAPGNLTYGEVLLPGEIEKEIFLSTYICHPSMANNELSGPVVATYLAHWLRETTRKFSVRMVFVPETIGSLVYLSRNLAEMKNHVVAGYNLTTIGDDRAFSFMPSRQGNTLADKAARHVLGHYAPEFTEYSFLLDRGSDERQYCAPGIDLPVASVMRSKYRTYPEYHTSLDDLSLISPAGLQGGYEAVQKCIQVIENNFVPRITVLGEPQLGKRGLYPSASTKNQWLIVRNMMNILAYSDGTISFLDLAEMMEQPLWELKPIMDQLMEAGLIEKADH